jgi:hypothetical protein
MTSPRRPERPGHTDQQAQNQAEQHAEQVLEQALRALAGGARQQRPPAAPGRPAPVPFTALQIVLLAVLLGLLVGMTAGVVSLLT